MNKTTRPDLAWTATVVLLAFMLFYLPVMLAMFGHDEPREWMATGIIMSTLYTAIFCLNYFWLVPALLLRRNSRTLFFAANLIMVMLACSLIPLWFEAHGGLPPRAHGNSRAVMSAGEYLLGYAKFVIRDGVMMILSAALAYALRLSKEQERMRRRELELDAERHNIELKSLKAQLNPHFLFNAINNIYALIGVSSDRAQKALYEFSGILRFLIYDASAVYVPLGKELGFIRDYVELMKLRLSSSTKLDCRIDDGDTAGLSIAPLLMLTLVENAFKHLSRTGAGRFISIRAGLEGEWLVCRVSNSCAPAGASQSNKGADSEAGVGLANVERQLRLLYPGAHSFSCAGAEGVYTAELRIARDRLTAPASPAQAQF